MDLEPSDLEPKKNPKNRQKGKKASTQRGKVTTKVSLYDAKIWTTPKTFSLPTTGHLFLTSENPREQLITKLMLNF